MRVIYNHTYKTNHVSVVCNFAAILYLQLMLIYSYDTVLYVDLSIFRIVCSVAMMD
jgi:hypothetical protein